MGDNGFMRLWTWQSKDFSIIDPAQKVDSLKYSRYLAERIPESIRSQFSSVYQKLWDILGTEQFHWSYTEEKDAKSKESNLEYNKGELLWEVDAPINNIFKIVCSVAWNYLLGNRNLIRQIYGFRSTLDEEFKEKFNLFWGQKNEDQLWGLLLLDLNGLHDPSPIFWEIIKPCTQVLLRHPVKEEWVTKNPFKLDNWWESQK
jgi:hypothetical protein